MKPAASRPITPSTRARTGSGNWRPNPATASIHSDCISTHSSIEPSCDPQAAVKRYSIGSIELEFSATLRTEKSFCANEPTRQAHASATNSACPQARGRAIAIHGPWPRHAPASASTPSSSASRHARINPKWPISGIIEAVVAARRRGARDYRTQAVTDARQAPTGSTGCAPRSASPGCRCAGAATGTAARRAAHRSDDRCARRAGPGTPA